MIKLADIEKERQVRLEEHIDYMLTAERDSFKLLIH